MMLYFAVFLSTLPFLFLFTQIKLLGEFSAAFANIAGLLGVVLMLWQLILGNRFVSRRISRDYLAILKLHVFLGVYGFFFVMTHPFLEMLAYGEKITFFFIPNFATEFGKHLILGRMAFYLYLLLWVTSALVRNKISRRVWLWLHYLSYPILFFSFLHAASIGTFLNTFVLLKVYFFILMGVFGILVLYRLSQLFDVGKFPYVLSAKKISAAGVTSYTFSPLATSLKTQVGQFFFIKPSIFAASHPFTVMSFDENSGDLTFSIKAIGNFTNKLESIAVGQTVFLDGPYGVFTKEGQNHEPKVILAGGIGITPFVELINRFGDVNTKLFYSNRRLEDILLREQFKAQLGANYIDVISEEKVENEPVVAGRITKDVLLSNLPEDFINKANFFICGSPSFMGGMMMVLKKLGVNKKRIFTEEFSL